MLAACSLAMCGFVDAASAADGWVYAGWQYLHYIGLGVQPRKTDVGSRLERDQLPHIINPIEAYLGQPRDVKVKCTDIAVRSVTCHTAAGTRMPYWIAQCYLPPDRADIPAFTPAEAGTRLSDPGGMQG